jgi:hypothetical protein
MTVVKFPAADIEAKQAKAYFDMEPHICDVVKMGTIAAQLFDDPDRELCDFAVHRLSEMLDELKAHTTTRWTSGHEAPAPIDQKA